MRLLRSTLPAHEGLSNSLVLNSSKVQLLLLLLHSGESHFLSLPVSLVELGGTSFFLSARNGSVHITSSTHTIYPFLEQATHRTNFPRFIHFSNDGVQLARQHEDCLALYNTYKTDDVQILQHFVHSNVKAVRKYRVHWSRSGPLRLSLIVNQKPTASPAVCHQRQAYLHNVSQYPFAGHLLRSSFSPHFLYAPRLKTTASPSLSMKRCLSSTMVQTSAVSDFIVRQSEVHSETSISISFPEIDAMTREFVGIVEQYWHRVSPSTKGTIDFIRDNHGHMQIIGCRFEGIQNLTLLISLSKQLRCRRIQTKTTIETNFTNYLEDFKLLSRIDKLRQQQAALKATISEKVHGSTELVRCPVWPHSSVQHSKKLKNSRLDQVAEDFDKLRRQAARFKQRSALRL